MGRALGCWGRYGNRWAGMSAKPTLEKITGNRDLKFNALLRFDILFAKRVFDQGHFGDQIGRFD